MTHLAAEPPPQTDANEALQTEVEALHNNPLLQRRLLNAPEHALLLNTQRQIVYANRTYHALANALGINGRYGQLLGGYLGCMHAQDAATSCGSKPACEHCGALNAINKSLHGAVAMQRCAIPVQGQPDPLYLVTLTIPVRIAASIYILTVFVDDNKIIEHPHTLAEHAFAVQTLAGEIQAA